MIIVGLLLYALRPNLVVIIKNKGAIDASPPIKIRADISIWGIFVPNNSSIGFSEVFPTAESESAIREIGAIVNDIQKLGDFGIEKWKK
jgi:hypothetical protein